MDNFLENRRAHVIFIFLIVFFFDGCLHRSLQGLWPPPRRVYLAGSCYSPYERELMQKISGRLKQDGYDTYMAHTDGLHAVMQHFREADRLIGISEAQMHQRLEKAIFCHELFRVIEDTDFYVFNMNGRTPDEGGTFLTGIAFSAGKPLVIYQNDHRTVFNGNNNSMIDGCIWNFSTLREMKDIPGALQRAAAYHGKLDVNPVALSSLPPFVQRAVAIGREIADYLDLVNLKGAADNPAPDEFLNGIDQIFKRLPLSVGAEKGSEVNKNKPKVVYCSGGLFSPEEIMEMQVISDLLEQNGYDTYLPHRDGVEAFVMNNVNGYFANSFLARPFLKYINKQVFALDVYQIIERCETFVFNMNGRVPDEGGVVEMAIAMMHGKPIVIYKEDPRSLLFGRSNPMLIGAGYDFTTAETMASLPARVQRSIAQKASRNHNPSEEIAIQPNVRKVMEYGHRIQRRFNRIQWAKPENKMWAP